MIEVVCRYEDDEPVLAVAGPLTEADLPLFRTVLDGTVDGGHRRMTVDLAGAGPVAPAVLQLCDEVAAALEVQGRHLRITRPAALADGAERMRDAFDRSHSLQALADATFARSRRSIDAGRRQRAADSPRAVAALQAEIEGLRAAMASRATIEQAKGIVMATVGCDVDEAFRVLVRQSQHENRKLRDVAAELVELQQRRVANA